jgi:membrane protease YdiL (CAAX protease family)
MMLQAPSRPTLEAIMLAHNNTTTKIIVYLAITFGLSAIFWAVMIAAGSTKTASGLNEAAVMWCPAAGAVITQLLFHRSLLNMGWRLGRARYLWTGYLLPVLYGLVMYVIVWVTGLGGFSLEQFAKTGAAQVGIQIRSPLVFAGVYLVILLVIGTISAIFTALGEEIGWRGLLVPELAKVTTFTKTALLSGIIWSIWHYPMLLFAGYNMGTPALYAIICFTISVVGLSVVFAWLRLKSGSIWPAVLLHASHNLFIKNIYTALTTNTGITNYIIDEFGIALLLAAIVLAYLYWHKRNELPNASVTPSPALPQVKIA